MPQVPGDTVPRAPQPCLELGCPNTATHRGRCTPHHQARRQHQDQRRATATERGYTSRGHRAFRHAVLARDPWCSCPGCPACSRPNRGCLRDSTDADHHPHTRAELVAMGANPNNPSHGRGLCHPCHSSHTTRTTAAFGR